jgi:glutamate dehydrogenase (NAD(P)+)
LIPAALESQIKLDNVESIKAKLVAEAANGPISFQASQRLFQKNIVVIPDIYLNAGGVTVSYLEWVKNLSHIRLGRIDRKINKAEEKDIVFTTLEETMITSFTEIKNICQKHDYKIDLRTSAYILAIDKIVSCYKDNGIFP